MNTNFEPFINYVTVFLDRVCPWFLTGKALSHFVCSGSIENCGRVEIGLLEPNVSTLKDKFETFGINASQNGEDVFEFDRNGYTVELQIYQRSRKGFCACRGKGVELPFSRIKAPEDEIDELRQKRHDMTGGGLWRRQINENSAVALSLPYCYGTILDSTLPDWYRLSPRREFPIDGEVFFNKNRRANGRALIVGLNAAAEKAGIRDRLFMGFGTLLGYIMFGDFIPKDRDMDMCILSDGLTTEQTDRYAEYAYNVDSVKPSRWEFSKREDTGKMLWFSVGYKNPVSDDGTKSCNWFFYSWNGMWWHSKGGKWVNPRKINQGKIGYNLKDEAVGLGLPQENISSLVEVDFNGVKVNIPSTPGSCLDVWYPGWCVKGDGASAHRNVMVVGKWFDENTWRMA